MKIIILKKDLSEAVQNVQRAVPHKASFPALEGIYMSTTNNALSLVGYDGNMKIETDVNARIIRTGGAVISAKLFSDVVKNLPSEEVTIEIDDKFIVTITSGDAKYELIGINPIEYPTFEGVESKEKVKIDGETLRDMIKTTVYAVSENNTKPIYTGALFKIKDGEFTIVAIDGYRMAARIEQTDSKLNTEVIIPKKALIELINLINDEVTFTIGRRTACFTLNNYTVTTRVIEGQFLDYRQTIPQETKTEVTISTKDLIKAVERMALLSKDKIQSPVIVNIGENIELTCKSSIGRAREIINGSVKGESLEMGFNQKYMLEALKNIEDDKVTIKFNGGLNPLVMSPDKSVIHLIVPMRLAQ